MKLVKESLNEFMNETAPGFYPKGYNKVAYVYSETIKSLPDKEFAKLGDYQDEERIKGRMSPTNDYIIFYKDGDDEVAEFLSNYEIISIDTNNESLNESEKGTLEKFVNNPEKVKLFIRAYSRQINKVKGLKNALLRLNDETRIKLANQSLSAMEDSAKGYPWIKISNGKIVGAGALGVKKGGLGSELGA